MSSKPVLPLFAWIVAVLHRHLEAAAVVPIEQDMNELCPMPGCRVEAITLGGPNLLHTAARGIRSGGRCPDCERASRAVHSRYRRRLADLPSLGRRVQIGLRARRFYCRNAKCARRTFAERLPELVAPHARRTGRLAEAQSQVGAVLGGEAGARLLQRLAMPASADTVLRLVRRMPLPEPKPPRVVAVDDWAKRRGRTYGTIVVDLKRRRVIVRRHAKPVLPHSRCSCAALAGGNDHIRARHPTRSAPCPCNRGRFPGDQTAVAA